MAEKKMSRWRVTVSDGGHESEFIVQATGCSDAALKAEKHLSDYRMAEGLSFDYEIIGLDWLDC